MTNELQVDPRGFLSFCGVSLFIRYEDRHITIPIKHPADRKRLGCKRLRIPIDEFSKLERRAREGAVKVRLEPPRRRRVIAT